jgi:2-keto-4-pentenoate hydratase/2-oxohepta-3-ene-1,7-dioic acid hydratase in catechol pathway
MRWVTYASPTGTTRAGLIFDDLVHGVRTNLSLLGIIEAGNDAMAEIAATAKRDPDEVVPLHEAELKSPLQPRTIRDGAGFLQHLRNNARVLGNDLDPRFLEYPPFYFGNATAVIGDKDAVEVPYGCEQLDYELEIGAVVGTPGRDISRRDADKHIAGYTIFCDWSARDLHMAERGLFAPMKGKDFANTLGPALVTPDELEEFKSDRGYKLTMEAQINGERTSRGTWSEVDWDFDDMITFASRGVTLQPGELLGSGTVPTGCLLEDFSHDPDNFRGWLKPGDVVSLEVEGIGRITNTIAPGRPVERLSSGH